MSTFKGNPDRYDHQYAPANSPLFVVDFPDFDDSLELLGSPGATLAEATDYARGRYLGERVEVRFADSTPRPNTTAQTTRKTTKKKAATKPRRQADTPQATARHQFDVYVMSGNTDDMRLGKVFPTGWTRVAVPSPAFVRGLAELDDVLVATRHRSPNDLRGTTMRRIGILEIADVERLQIANKPGAEPVARDVADYLASMGLHRSDDSMPFKVGDLVNVSDFDQASATEARIAAPYYVAAYAGADSNFVLRIEATGEVDARPVKNIRSIRKAPERETAGSPTGRYFADTNPAHAAVPKAKRKALGLKATGETKIKGAVTTWTASPADVYSPMKNPGALAVMDSGSKKGTGQWQVRRAPGRAERDAGGRAYHVVIVRNAKGHQPSGAKVPKGSIDLWEFNPASGRLMGSPRVLDWKGTARELLEHYDRIQAKKLGLPEPGIKPAAKKPAAKKPAAKKPRKIMGRRPAAMPGVTSALPKNSPARKRARAKAEDEIRLLKRSGKLIATYGVSYSLTKAMEEIRDCARRSKPCKLKTVISAYDQLRNAAKSPGKSPRQGLAYYIAAELAKDLKRSSELEAVGKGDHPRIKEA